MKTLADLMKQPGDVQEAPHGTVFTVKCSCPSCNMVIKLPRHVVLDKIKSGSVNAYCCRRCRSQHVLEQAIVIRGGVEGRVCISCGEWTPMNKMTRGCLCGKCKRGQPRQKFAVSRSQVHFRGGSWSLSYEEAMKFWNQPCYYCGDPIEGLRLDQINPQEGYKVGNVVSCCWACNRGKGNDTQEGFIARCHRVVGLDEGTIK